jgi:hypothetical protein
MGEEIKSGQAEMRSTVCAMRSKLKESIQHGMKVVIQPIQSESEETTACNKATETKPDPGMMQSIEEHQEFPKEDTAVMPVRELRKRRRVPEYGRKAPPVEEGKDLGKWWIQEEVGCHLQEGIPPCKSGKAKREPLQECSDPKKVRSTEEIWYQQEADTLCRSGTAQRTRTPENSQRQ